VRIAVIPAAGSGRRFGGRKQFFEVLGRPVVEFPIEVFQKSPLIDGIVLVFPEEDLEFGNKFKLKYDKVISVVPGGSERQFSVYKGLSEAAKFKPSEVLIHDGVRPFLELSTVEDLVVALSDYEADGVILGVKPKETVKRVGAPLERGDFLIEETLNREKLVLVQTPQLFKFDVIYECHERALKEDFMATDDSALLERYGFTVVSIPGDYRNVKITTPEDVKIVELFLKEFYPEESG
jgi:2-C-methyl-D-erythritol 4-phosphate cytidylyltransferase